MNPVCRMSWWLLVVVMVLGAPRGAAGQRGWTEEYILRSDGEEPDLDLRTARRGFRLFAAADGALTGMRMVGNHGAKFSNYADCDNVMASCQNQRMVRAVGGSVALWFYNSWIAGAPPSEWRKIREVAPSVANATGGGWTAGFNEELTGGATRFGPADLTLGRLFSGVTSTSDGTCRDNSGFGNAFISSGIPLLAQSVCPETWGSAGWQGGQSSSVEQWAAWRNQTGSSAFRFDFWRIPLELRRDGYLGGRMHAYGETTDYHENILSAWGSVIPGGTGAPAIQGYPLGLLVRFDVFTSSHFNVEAVKFVRALVINRSEDVWGTGIDYDSLYFGLSAGELGSASTGTAHYYLPEMGGVIRVVAGANTDANPCNDAFREPVFGCGPSNGWRLGSQALLFFKTPIGDLRNKLFTRRADGTPCVAGTDPFCDPAHPLRADTFTLNQGRMCGFGNCNTYVWVGGGARSGFGHLSGNEEHTNAGRDINSVTAGQAWSTYRSPIWPVRDLYSKWQPDPNWDYNKDGIPDTLGLTSCHTDGCVGLASDTLPGGFVNLSSNVGGVHAAGPFALRAGDTTSFWYAVIGERDSVAVMTQVEAALDLYLNFLVGPEAPPPVEIVSSQATAALGADGLATPSVRLFLSDDVLGWRDLFLDKVADDVDAAASTTRLGVLRDLNPDLASQLRARAADNVDRVEIYKSCDGGATFTASADCRGDPIVDSEGQALGQGWQAWATFHNTGPGSLPAMVLDSTVQGGRTYLYVVVARSRGAELQLIQPDGAGGTIIGPVPFAPAIRNPLSRQPSDPNVVAVYVPLSRAAGYRQAVGTITARPAGVTAPFGLDVSDDAVPGNYTATFGNRILVERDSLPDQPVSATTLVVERRLNADVGGTTTPVSVFSERYRLDGDAVVPFAGVGTADTSALPDGTVRVTTTYDALGLVVHRDGVPLFGSTQLTGTGATPAALFRSAANPGFAVSANQAVAGAYDTTVAAQLRGPLSIGALGLAPADTVVPRDAVNRFMPQWQAATTLSVRTSFGGGAYEITWTDDAWGQAEGLVLDRYDVEQFTYEVGQALAARTFGTIARTDAAAASLSGMPADELVPARIPFTVHNVTFDRPVDLAMLRRASPYRKLGSGLDTLSIEIPDEQWVPGDPLIFIEDVPEDSATAVGIVLDGAGQPIPVARPRVTFSSAVIGCNQVRLSCNPLRVGTPGATGHAPIRAGDRMRFGYYTPFLPGTMFDFTLAGATTGDAISVVTDSALARVQVVPNPFVVYSTFQSDVTRSRIAFTNVPPRGTIRIYTVAGQFVQQIVWEPGDVAGAGDLFYNLQTRGDRPLASGLYLWVLTAPSDPGDPASAPRRVAGKFVVIRGAMR